MNWKHRWIHADNPYVAFEIWLEARWPHPFEGEWIPLATKAYAADDEVPREMLTPKPTMPNEPF